MLMSTHLRRIFLHRMRLRNTVGRITPSSPNAYLHELHVSVLSVEPVGRTARSNWRKYNAELLCTGWWLRHSANSSCRSHVGGILGYSPQQCNVVYSYACLQLENCCVRNNKQYATSEYSCHKNCLISTFNPLSRYTSNMAAWFYMLISVASLTASDVYSAGVSLLFLVMRRGFGFVTFVNPTSVDKVLAAGVHQLDAKVVSMHLAVCHKQYLSGVKRRIWCYCYKIIFGYADVDIGDCCTFTLQSCCTN